MSQQPKTSLVDLTKKVQIILEKKNVQDIKAQVGFVMDVSGSMKDLYDNGTMQEVVNRIQALAVKFDDNQILDNWAFDNEVFKLPAAGPGAFGSYVSRYMTGRRDFWHGTSFAPALREIAGAYGTDDECPVYIIFLTDGDNNDKYEAEQIIQGFRGDIYIQFVGIGTATKFQFLKDMADKYKHVGFIDFSDPSATTDEQMYEKLLNDEFINFVKG